MDYKCAICGKEINETMCQISIFNPENKYELIGSACMSCEGDEGLKLIKVYNVGNKDIGWCCYDDYKDAIEVFGDLDYIADNGVEIVSTWMIKKVFDSMPEFEGY